MDIKLDREQRQRANNLIESDGLSDDIAFELVAMRDLLLKIANETCNHGPMTFCPREEARKVIDTVGHTCVPAAPTPQPVGGEGHSPLPWRNFGGMVDGYGIADANNNVIVPQQPLMNEQMRLIVTAVNTHAPLLERVSELEGVLRRLRTWLVSPATDAVTILEMRELIDTVATSETRD